MQKENKKELGFQPKTFLEDQFALLCNERHEGEFMLEWDSNPRALSRTYLLCNERHKG